ncbi:hypothetical protein [Aeromicrobium sp. UC242_57]|uniref:hypothetical protein n=1 Tax=Aeromicrobium sp. UC242_57 TaxID=3374624 RepID=UPI00378FC547
MRVFRKVILPVVWVVIFSVIAVSLAVLAFGDEPQAEGSGVKPTGEMVLRNTVVERGSIENTLEVGGTIVVDPPVEAKASHDGVITYVFLPVGAQVKAGDALFQIKSEGEVSESGESDDEDKAPSKPRPTYHNVLATRDGKVASYAKSLNDPVAKGDVVGTVRRDTFKASGSIAAVDQYRLLDPPRSATVTISDGPAPFKCGDLTIGATSTAAPESGGGYDEMGMDEGEPMGGEGGGASVTCVVPEDVRVFDQLEMTMSIDVGRAEEVLVIPVTAVRGLIGKGSVWVMTDGEPVERKVRLGISDGQVVEVRKGVEEGDEILEFVPGGATNNGEEDPYAEGMDG